MRGLGLGECLDCGGVGDLERCLGVWGGVMSV